MSTIENKAAYLEVQGTRPLKVGPVAPAPAPGPGQATIKVHSVAINPVDAMIQLRPEAVALTFKYPYTPGCDAAGEVVAVGEGVTKLQVGDRVVATTDQGAFQHFSTLDCRLTTRLPDNISYSEGCVLPLGLCTAAVALFQSNTLNLDFPQVVPKPNGKVVLVWGAASSVGSCAVQMIRAAGYEVATIAGPDNQQYCRDLGASYTFDYKRANVETEILVALSEKPFAGIFDAIITEQTIATCARIAAQLGNSDENKVVATVLPPAMALKKDPVEGVRIAYCYGTSLRDNEVGPAVWDKWLTPALANGSMLCKPSPKVVGKGLEAIQEALDLMAKGVSASKLVVELV